MYFPEGPWWTERGEYLFSVYINSGKKTSMCVFDRYHVIPNLGYNDTNGGGTKYR